jgi:hypothetical protein
VKAFGEHGEPIGAVDFDYDALDRTPEDVDGEDLARVRQQTIIRVFQMIGIGTGDARRIGQRVLLIGFLLRLNDCKTQKELARRMGVTAGRASQALKSARREFSALARKIPHSAKSKTKPSRTGR